MQIHINDETICDINNISKEEFEKTSCQSDNIPSTKISKGREKSTNIQAEGIGNIVINHELNNIPVNANQAPNLYKSARKIKTPAKYTDYRYETILHN